MKLLFDANLSPKLANRLASLFPGSSHVFNQGLHCETADPIIWRYARDHGFTVVTTDSDFLAIAEKEGHPPYLVRIDRCTLKTSAIEDLLRCNAIRIAALEGILRIKNKARESIVARAGLHDQK